MPALSEDRIAALLRPYLDAEIDLPSGNTVRLVETDDAALLPKLSIYLDLLLRWNAHTNLTALRDPERIAERHFGESLFAGRVLARLLEPCSTLLDVGSGPGFPGVPIALLLPEIHVTLAESQQKKAAFLREVLRALDLSGEVWSNRAEALPEERRFSAVTLRAVDQPEAALAIGQTLVEPGGWLLEITTGARGPGDVRLPGLAQGIVRLRRSE